MSADLKYLAFTAILTASLWIPYIACQVMTNGPLSGENYVDPAPRPVPLWGQRAHRAYLNAIECFAPFAALVETGATLAFDAIGGGKLASQILTGMEMALNKAATTYSRYGSRSEERRVGKEC